MQVRSGFGAGISSSWTWVGMDRNRPGLSVLSKVLGGEVTTKNSVMVIKTKPNPLR